MPRKTLPEFTITPVPNPPASTPIDLGKQTYNNSGPRQPPQQPAPIHPMLEKQNK